MKAVFAAAAAAALLAGPVAFAQEQASDNMEIVREKVRADKKLLVASSATSRRSFASSAARPRPMKRG